MNNPKSKVILQIECMIFRLQGYNFTFRKCDYSSQHTYKDLLKVNEFIHYVNFVADHATPNRLTIHMIKKATKNDKLLHQLINLARQSNCYKLNKEWTFLRYIENRDTFKHFLKTYSELTVDDD